MTLLTYAWLMTLLLQVAAVPWLLTKLDGKLADSGWALGRVTTWLLIGLPVWFLGHLSLPVNTDLGVWGLFLIILGGSLWWGYQRREQLVEKFSKIWKIVVVEEGLFLAGFIFLGVVRSFNPQILDLEKFMDAGFMASYLRAETLPAPDMWLAGETINYYSFGHFLGSLITRIWQMEIAYTYNFLLAFIMGLTLMLSFSVVYNLVASAGKEKGRGWLWPAGVGGLVGSLLVTVSGNTQTLWFYLKNRTFQGYWYADATRFIERTIHEFPSYSFVVSDLHGHVWNLPLVLSFLMVVLVWARSLKGKRDDWPALVSRLRQWFRIRSMKSLRAELKQVPWLIPAIAIGMLLGVFVMTSTWDFLIYSMVMVILAGVKIYLDPKWWPAVVASAVAALLMALITALPWILTFDSISEGAAIATEHSPLWQLLALWSGHVTVSGLAIILGLKVWLSRKKPSEKVPAVYWLVIGLVVSAWILLLLPELVYVKDIYTGHPRANTMFKLTYQAFILMGLAGGFALGSSWLVDWKRKAGRNIISLLVLAVLAVTLPFAYFSYRDYYGGLKIHKGLNGYRWLYEQHPDDYNGIRWMQENISGQPVILEAVGESYTTFDRVSTVTGLPTVLGWRVHEWLWRGGFDIPGQRTVEVQTMFERPLSQEALNLYDQYQVAYVFVGDKEYEAYEAISAEEIRLLGEVVFEEGRTFIVKRPVVGN